MPYVFGRVDTGERNPFFPYHWVGADYDFMELIQGYWYEFAASGDPNGEGRPVWKKYEKNFDIINLPSKGEGYKDKIKKVSVSYLTAYDENMIVTIAVVADNGNTVYKKEAIQCIINMYVATA